MQTQVLVCSPQKATSELLCKSCWDADGVAGQGLHSANCSLWSALLSYAGIMLWGTCAGSEATSFYIVPTDLSFREHSQACAASVRLAGRVARRLCMLLLTSAPVLQSDSALSTDLLFCREALVPDVLKQRVAGGGTVICGATVSVCCRRPLHDCFSHERAQQDSRRPARAFTSRCAHLQFCLTPAKNPAKPGAALLPDLPPFMLPHLCNCTTPVLTAAEAPRSLKQALQQGSLQPETAVQAERIMDWLQKQSSS